jgi:hypothetical protein
MTADRLAVVQVKGLNKVTTEGQFHSSATYAILWSGTFQAEKC